MSLLNLETPYRMLRVVDYDNNIPVIKNRRLQHIAGSLYKDREKKDSSNCFRCRVYAFYPEIKIGIFIDGVYDLDRFTPERLHQLSIERKFDSFSSYQVHVQDLIQKNSYIPGGDLLLMEIHAPELAKEVKRVREEYFARKQEEKRLKREEEKQKQITKIRKANDEAVGELVKITGTIRSNSDVYADDIVFHRNEAGSVYNCLNLLADIYEVSIPINVRSWINKKCVMIRIRNGRIEQYSHRKGNSQTFTAYMQQVVDRIIADPEDSAITKWRDGLYDLSNGEQAA